MRERRDILDSEQRCRSAWPRYPRACLSLRRPTGTPKRRRPDSAIRFYSVLHSPAPPRMKKATMRRTRRSMPWPCGGGGRGGTHGHRHFRRFCLSPCVGPRWGWNRVAEMRGSWWRRFAARTEERERGKKFHLRWPSSFEVTQVAIGEVHPPTS